MRHVMQGAWLAFVAVSAVGCGPDTDRLEQAAIAALQSELPAMQDSFLAAHGRYANHIRELTGGEDTLASGIRVLVNGDANGWSASASHRDVPGAACTVFVGEPAVRISLRGRVGGRRPGEIGCIAFGPWQRRKVIEPSGPYRIGSSEG